MYPVSADAGFADALRGGARTDGRVWQGLVDTAGARQGRGRSGERAELAGLIEAARRLVEVEQAQPAIGDAALSR